MFEVCAPYIWEPDAASSEFKQAPAPLENIMILGLHSPPPPEHTAVLKVQESLRSAAIQPY